MGPGIEETLLEQGPDAFMLLTADGTIVFVNAAAERLFGYRREQLLGGGHQILLSDDERGGFLRVFGRLGRGNPAATLPVAAAGRHQDGREIFLEITCSLVQHDGGAAMAVALRDGSHRQDTDAGRRLAVSLLDATLETTADAILVVSNDGQITGVNDQYLKLWSMPPNLVAASDPMALIDFIAGQLANPDYFRGRVSLLYADKLMQSNDLLEFSDGRTVELNSRPQEVAGAVVGRIWNFRDITSRSRAQHQARRAMEELAEQAAKLKELAFRDPLTGLANRMLFNERAAAALLTSEPVHVLLLDLDDFKEVNDVLGHHAGDEMLVEISRRLQGCVGPHGTVARLGGDEFVVLLVGCRDADAVAQRVVGALNAPVSIEGTLMRPGLSLGVASSDDGTATSSELLRRADLAMYAAKEAGKNCYVHFRPEMLTALLERTQLTAGLRRAVELGQIRVHYQPVVSSEQLKVVQFEALARWEWQGQLMAPDGFIEIAERSGLIREIGAEVLRRSCAELSGWLAEDPARSLAVNVSGVQLQHRDFAERVLDIAACGGTDPHQLVLEVTESVFFDAHSHVIEQLERLRGAGIRVALDDFGTGYSSLGRLQELPVDVVKIDKSFISMLRSGAEKLPILTSMINMASSLGLKVTAEGIETPAQASYLMERGCDALQGFLFSRPEPEARRELAIRRSMSAIEALEAAPEAEPLPV
ncbi:EAL domain-containing protein [Arthrobacter sp. AL08]|uniref:putative bifunctional diguanylate cyclase/phosphodiesterase n=1 Tax=unclassified Arthrobacter TaxID=235627 RepID=UPI001CFFE916|nr:MULTISPECIES: EAL domain-containing protein [unclassified Arthrobacter]MDI3240422.1 EAL domain-containing protein [Arthrobacter sp. AL05]MDI3276432.1 EAL domain-containing protein [Arthrobacter sp. AL08]WGZ80144.1 EAL domain-containing protein [Arthrobacter sp. EM1]